MARVVHCAVGMPNQAANARVSVTSNEQGEHSNSSRLTWELGMSSATALLAFSIISRGRFTVMSSVSAVNFNLNLR